MLDMLCPPEVPACEPHTYAGPERRSAASRLITRWFAQMLDEVDYGMLLLADETHVVHANHAARRVMDDEHPLQLLGRELRVRRTRDLAPLHDALAGATSVEVEGVYDVASNTLTASKAVLGHGDGPGDDNGHHGGDDSGHHD